MFLIPSVADICVKSTFTALDMYDLVVVIDSLLRFDKSVFMKSWTCLDDLYVLEEKSGSNLMTPVPAFSLLGLLVAIVSLMILSSLK